MRCSFRPHNRDRTTESMEGFCWVSGLIWRGVGLQDKRGFRLARLTVGASNDLQMERNLTGGLPVIYQGHSENLGPFRERFSAAHKTRSERGDRARVRVVGLRTDNGEKRGNLNGCKF